jgi:hypothetical protein
MPGREWRTAVVAATCLAVANAAFVDTAQAGIVETGAMALQNRDADLATLSQRMRVAPAGGDVLAVIGITFVVLLILELVGVIDIFKKIG